MISIPDYLSAILDKIYKAGWEGYIVGGSVRDILLNKEPKDWDITTNAKPEDILKIFPDGKYENVFGTVLVAVKNEQNETKDVVEITTYRSEGDYNDKRHPEKVVFEENLEKDLSRRDFTVNAMAIKPLKDEKNEDSIKIGKEYFLVVDLFGGQKDLKKKIIRTVGEPSDRFKEDALRMMRAIRFCCQLGFSLEPKTERGILKLAGNIKFIAKERIKDELIKILSSDFFYDGFVCLYKVKLLQYIFPELIMGDKVSQSGHHIYDVFEHSLLSLKYCPSKEWQVRLAALLHDIGKVKAKKIINNKITFYNHEYIGAKIAEKIMDRLRFSALDSKRIINLVRNHMFYYNVGEVTEASVRRLIVKVGKENLKDLIDLRIADRLGSGTPKAMPYKLRHLQYMMEKVQNDPVSVKMLKIDGHKIMADFKIEPGPKIGAILDVLLSEVIEKPELNNQENLSKRVSKLLEFDLQELREKAKDVISEKQQEDDQKIRKNYKV